MIRLTSLLFAVLCAVVPVGAIAGSVTVFAAASLQGALLDIAREYDGDVRFSFGGSGTMARQIATGAPADVVILAHTVWMDWLIERDVAQADATRIIAGNRLVVIGPAGSPAVTDPTSLGALLVNGRLAMGQRDAVPAGIYARQWLMHAGLWETLVSRLAETDNVRAALALVARGEAPLGIVYASDALSEPGVSVVMAIPADSHAPVSYPATGLSAQGRAFVDHLSSPAAQAILTRHGFERAPR